MGKNKLQKFNDMEGYPHVFQYPFNSLQNEPFPLKGLWNTSFFANEASIVLELGCGKGEYTVAQAEQQPQKNFIGVDIKGARMWSGAKSSLLQGMRNVAFLRTNIEMIDAFFIEKEVSEIWITFPDPQMQKPRKRLTGTLFLERYRRILSKGGEIHLKTDSPFLYEYTKALIAVNQLPMITCIEDLYASSLKDDPVLSIKTHYEQQWLERGFTIKYLRFKLPEDPEQVLVEPSVEIPFDAYRSYNRSKRSGVEAGC